MNVVSLFNGMNTGRQALKNIGVKVDKYYSSEIKPYAIELTQHHFSDTIQVGDVTKWREWDIDWQSVDLILSGSPCQDLSIAGKQKGINGSRSVLFFTFVDILNHIKSLNPNVLFLQENVGSAPSKDVGIMSRALGVYPCQINSNLLVAQNRNRLYWSNIITKKTMFDVVTDIPQPKDRKIFLKDIIESGFTDKQKADTIQEREYKNLYKDLDKLKIHIEKKTKQGFMPPLHIKEVIQVSDSKESYGKQPYQQNRIYDAKGIYPALLTQSNGFIKDNYTVRNLTKGEFCKLQGFPPNYCDILPLSKAISLLGDGWTLPVIEHIFSFLPQHYFL
jgi:DNA (cytosine-5)-methyltransferase 3A